MKYFRIGYSCGCGETIDFITAETFEEAMNEAYEYAVDDYQSYEGLYGVRSVEDFAEELYGEECDLEYLSDGQWEEAFMMYREAIESEIDYWAEEISKEDFENEEY